MAHFTILWEGQPVPASGNPAPASNTYEISAIPEPTPQADFPLSIQWQGDGVNAGLPNARIINLVSDPANWLVTRGTGEQSNVVTVRKIPPLDPLWDSVLLLVQGGTIVDQSSYAHPMEAIGSGVTASTVLEDVPGGAGIRINATHNGGGVQITPIGTEFNQGNTQARCYEWFTQIQSGVIGLGSQIVWNDGFAFNGNTVFNGFDASAPYDESRISLRLSGAATYVAPAEVAAVVPLETWFCAIQIPANGTDLIKYWTGRVSDGVAVGADGLNSAPRPIDAVTQGPYIGYVGGSGGENDFILGPYRITAGVRYTADTITIPTSLFPVG